MILAIAIVIVVVAAICLGLALRRRTPTDGVDSFRRQIDALSPEARRPTIDQVKSAERPDERPDDSAGESGRADDDDTS